MVDILLLKVNIHPKDILHQTKATPPPQQQQQQQYPPSPGHFDRNVGFERVDSFTK